MERQEVEQPHVIFCNKCGKKQGNGNWLRDNKVSKLELLFVDAPDGLGLRLLPIMGFYPYEPAHEPDLNRIIDRIR